jgi:hypothetical protein
MVKEVDYWITKGNDSSPGGTGRTGAGSSKPSKYAAASLFDEG